MCAFKIILCAQQHIGTLSALASDDSVYTGEGERKSLAIFNVSCAKTNHLTGKLLWCVTLIFKKDSVKTVKSELNFNISRNLLTRTFSENTKIHKSCGDVTKFLYNKQH